jgi:hypothetical protein
VNPATINIKVIAKDAGNVAIFDEFALAQVVKQSGFVKVAATTSATGRLAIYGSEVKDLSGVDLNFNLSGAVKQSTPPNDSTDQLSDFLELVEDGNKATVYLKDGVTMASLIAALVNGSFNLNVVNGDVTVTDEVTLGGTGSDIQTLASNNAEPKLNSLTSTEMLNNVTTGDGRKVVYQASATDANAGLFTFGLDGPDARFFDIDSISGAVTIKSEFVNNPEFLVKDKYTVNVIASDGVLGATRSSSTQVVIDNPEVSQAPGVKVVATTAGAEGINDRNAIVGVTQTEVAPSQLPTGVDMPFGRSLIVASQEDDQGSVPTNFSIYVAPNANINGFWTTVNGGLVNLADSALGGAWNPETGEIKLDLAAAADVMNVDLSNIVIDGELTLEGAPAKIDLGSLGANPLQVNDLFWS